MPGDRRLVLVWFAATTDSLPGRDTSPGPHAGFADRVTRFWPGRRRHLDTTWYEPPDETDATAGPHTRAFMAANTASSPFLLSTSSAPRWKSAGVSLSASTPTSPCSDRKFQPGSRGCCVLLILSPDGRQPRLRDHLPVVSRKKSANQNELIRRRQVVNDFSRWKALAAPYDLTGLVTR